MPKKKNPEDDKAPKKFVTATSEEEARELSKELKLDQSDEVKSNTKKWAKLQEITPE